MDTAHSLVSARDVLLYAVTDSQWLGGRSLVACVQQAIEGGATFVQLREKGATHAQRVQLALEVKQVCDSFGVPFVVNDDVECALEVDADGVHVGQDDMAARTARAMLGPNKIVGVSAHTVEEARAAWVDGADYLGVTAHATPTKPDAEGIAAGEMASICASVDIPVVAIGGLNAETIPALAKSGASGAAVVSAIFAQSDCYEAARALRSVCEKTFWVK